MFLSHSISPVWNKFHRFTQYHKLCSNFFLTSFFFSSILFRISPILFHSGIIECKEPIEVVSYKIGVCKVSPKGKDCTTVFQKLGFNGKTSVVLCKPKTGRMHQIRVHLQFLGELTFSSIFSLHSQTSFRIHHLPNDVFGIIFKTSNK